VKDRKKWKDLVRQAKAHSGLQYQWKRRRRRRIRLGTVGHTRKYKFQIDRQQKKKIFLLHLTM
jgi:hypothetical protein